MWNYDDIHVRSGKELWHHYLKFRVIVAVCAQKEKPRGGITEFLAKWKERT